MAIYSVNVSNVSRAKGSSSVASLSYIASMQVRDERTGEMHYGYGRRERVLAVRTVLPEGAAGEWRDPRRLFNSIEAKERAANARPAKKIMIALPRELSREEALNAVDEWVDRNLTRRGYAATYAMHEDKAGNNPHVHVLVANRQVDPRTGDWAKTKTRKEYALDEQGRRIPLMDRKTGEQKTDKRGRKRWKRVSVQSNPLDEKATLEAMREDWAQVANKYLEPYGERIDHRSNQARGIEDEPTQHEGYAAREMEARGVPSDRVRTNRQIRLDNYERQEAEQQLNRLDEERLSIMREQAERADEPRNMQGWRDLAADTLHEEQDLKIRIARDYYTQALATERQARSVWGREGSPSWPNVWALIKKVFEAIKDAVNARFGHKHAAQANVEHVAAQVGEQLKSQAPWLENHDVPTSQQELEAYAEQCREQTLEHDLEPFTQQVEIGQRKLDHATHHRITRNEIEVKAEQLAEGHGVEKPRDRGTKPKERGTKEQLRSMLSTQTQQHMQDAEAPHVNVHRHRHSR